MTTSAPIRACLLGACLTLGACRAAVAPSEPRPADVPSAPFASTIWIGAPGGPGIEGYASAVVLGPRHLLTNAHVWSEQERWREAELPAQRSLLLLQSGELVPATFRLAASGIGGPERLDDWVLLEADEPRWDPSQAAKVHPPATELGWTVAEERPLAVAGFTSLFLELGPPAPAVGGPAIDEPLAWGDLQPFFERGPYLVLGESILVEGDPALRYPAGWPPPVGHSGGGVYLWDAARAEARLIGLFSSWVPTRSIIHRRSAPLGISALATERTTEEDGWVLTYVPLAPALLALGGTR